VQRLPELFSGRETFFDIDGHGALDGGRYMVWNACITLLCRLKWIIIAAPYIHHTIEGVFGYAAG